MAETTPYHDASRSILSAGRLVIKVGSALFLRDDGTVAASWLATLASDIADLRVKGVDVSIVSSGAVGLGRALLGMKTRPRLEDKQAAAAAGQSLLMNAWRTAFAPHDVNIAQILLTLDDAENRRRYLNARSTILTLLDLGAVPIINENDTTATAELRYGDNDRLAAHVAQMCGATGLVMLTDIDGLYDANPHVKPDAKHIGVVDAITSEIAAMAGGPNVERGAGSGGMKTKIEAAKIATSAGCAVVIAQGNIDSPLSALEKGARATLFSPSATPEKARRAWIGGRLKPKGAIHIDDGATTALTSGASLLPAGVTQVENDFEKGDAVSIIQSNGALIGQGLSAYDSRDLKAVMGLTSSAVENVLGYRRAAAIHRDDLVLSTDM